MEPRCRLCAENSAEMVHIFEDMQYVELPARIMDLFKIKIALEDQLPTTVCFFCCDMVQKIWAFNECVQKSQGVLAELVGSNSVSVHVPYDEGCKELTNSVEEVVEEQAEDEPQTQPALVSTTELIDHNELHSFVQEEPEVPEETPPSSQDSAETKHFKSKIRKLVKKKRSRVIYEIFPDLTDAELNEDGSITVQVELFGWEAYPWACCDCQQNLLNPEDLRDHYATVHVQPAKYGCADCAKIYTKYSTFLTHVRVHRLKLQFCCDVCFKWFPSVDSQEKHRSQHSSQRPHACSTCGKHFRMQSALLVHSRSHLPAELKNRYQCDQCPKRFGTKPNLMAHKRIHAGVRDFTCDQCGKSFVQKGNLDNHLLTHTAARPFSCPICAKAFKTHVRLRKHASVHSGFKPHQCDVCGRQFRERGTLKEHHRIHTGAMPFTCEFCGKSFRFKGVLTTHRRQHTGERPYSCFDCQHHFTNWPNYNKHMKRRHGINTSVTVRKPQSIPPTGMPHRNPPGTVLAPPQPITVAEAFAEPAGAFYPVLSLYNLPEELLQQRV